MHCVAERYTDGKFKSFELDATYPHGWGREAIEACLASLAAQAEDAVQRASNLEPYQREQLVNAIHLRFPLQRKDTGPGVLYALAESIDAKRQELHHIMTVNLSAGTILHVVNGIGDAADTTRIGVPVYIVEYPLP